MVNSNSKAQPKTSMRRKKVKGETFSDRVIRYIITRHNEEFAILSVQSLAREFKVDRYKLLRTFKKETNMTLESYLLQERMSRCAFLLMADKRITIKAVSEIMGFCTPDYFIQVFKKYFGIAPGLYKEYKTRRTGRERRTHAPDRRSDRRTTDCNPPKKEDRRKGTRDRRKGVKDRRRGNSMDTQKK
jgi:AraC-like DNA-binding protein